MPFSFTHDLWGVYSNIMFIAFLEPSRFRFSCISCISRMTGDSRSFLCVSYSLSDLYEESLIIIYYSKGRLAHVWFHLFDTARKDES